MLPICNRPSAAASRQTPRGCVPLVSICAALMLLGPRAFSSPARAQSADGFAGVGSTVTGGAGGPEVTVTTGEDLKKYADSNGPYVIYVSGKLKIHDMDTHVRSNKTIIGKGPDATLDGGGLYLYKASNVIIRNLTIQGSGDDCMGLLLSSNIWIDHCTFQDAKDGNLDIRRASDNITISWCKFCYTTKQEHAFSCLLGSSDAETDCEGKLHVTFHHNWFGDNVSERMPSIRFGTVHLYNNYYSSAASEYCVRVRLSAQARLEHNCFEGVKNPWEVYVTDPAHVLGRVLAKDNLEINTTWGTTTTSKKDKSIRLIVPGTDNVFTPPYAYTPDPASKVKELVTRNAGAGKLPAAALATGAP